MTQYLIFTIVFSLLIMMAAAQQVDPFKIEAVNTLDGEVREPNPFKNGARPQFRVSLKGLGAKRISNWSDGDFFRLIKI
jgi:hypothetical protein